jgi:hypothetical protein
VDKTALVPAEEAGEDDEEGLWQGDDFNPKYVRRVGEAEGCWGSHF